MTYFHMASWQPLGFAAFYLLAAVFVLGFFVAFRKKRGWRLIPGLLCLLLLLAFAATLLPGLLQRPGLRADSAEVVCAGWSRPLAWMDVVEVTGERAQRGAWYEDRILLKVEDRPLAAVAGSALDEGPWRWIYFLAFAGGKDIEVQPGATLACNLQSLELPQMNKEDPGLVGLFQALASANREDFSNDIDRLGLEWCEISGNFTAACVSDAAVTHEFCMTEVDYEACRLSLLR